MRSLFSQVSNLIPTNSILYIRKENTNVLVRAKTFMTAVGSRITHVILFLRQETLLIHDASCHYSYEFLRQPNSEWPIEYTRDELTIANP